MDEYPVRGGVLNETPLMIPPPQQVTTKTTSFLCGNAPAILEPEEPEKPLPLTPPPIRASSMAGADYAIETAVGGK
jgi:hypothetical protein